MASRRRDSGFTEIEFLLCALFVAAAAFAVVPDVVRIREELPVERAAWALRRCDSIARALCREGVIETTHEATLQLVEDALPRLEQPPLGWPRGTDLSTLEFHDDRGTSVDLLMPDGSRRRVSSRDVPETCIR